MPLRPAGPEKPLYAVSHVYREISAKGSIGAGRGYPDLLNSTLVQEGNVKMQVVHEAVGGVFPD